MLPINRNPGAREIRAFARIWFPLFVAALGAMIWWRTGSLNAAVVAWTVGAALVILALASRSVARAIFVALITITYPIGFVISTIVLAVMFYAVFTPLGLVMRLVGRDPLHLRRREAPTEWTPYHQDDDPARAFRQY